MSAFHNVKMMLVQMLAVSSLILITMTSARGHEVSATVGDLSVENGKAMLSLRITLESYLAGIDLDETQDTDDIPEAAVYEAFRALSPDALNMRFRAFAPEMLAAMTLSVDGNTVPFQISGLDIPDVDDLELPRTSVLELLAAVGSNAKTLQLSWPDGYGPLLLRQIGPEDPFTGFMTGGEKSPEISIKGIEAEDGNFFSRASSYISSWF